MELAGSGTEALAEPVAPSAAPLAAVRPKWLRHWLYWGTPIGPEMGLWGKKTVVPTWSRQTM